MLRDRVITAIIMTLVIASALLLLPAQGFMLAIVLVFAVAGWEWADLSGIARQPGRWLYALAVAVLSLAAAWQCGLFAALQPALLRDILGLGGLWWALALLWVMSYPVSARLWGSVPARLLMGLLVLVPAALALQYLVVQAHGQWYFIYLVAIIAAADIGAYFCGRAFGKRKLAVQVSPGKSWAGFFGGLACCALLALLVGSQWQVAGLTQTQLVLVSLVASLASVLGDLVESMVKRHRGLKDSSQLLPGHGGVMDRIDSMTAAAPVFVLLQVLLLQVAA